MKRLAMMVAACAALAVAGNTWAFGVSVPTTGGAVEGAVKGAAKGAVKGAAKKGLEQQINSRLASYNCTFKGNSTNTTCDLNKVSAELKAQHTVAEKSGIADFNINVTAYGPDAKTADKRAEVLKNRLKILFGGWDYNVTSDVGTNNLEFKVSLD